MWNDALMHREALKAFTNESYRNTQVLNIWRNMSCFDKNMYLN